MYREGFICIENGGTPLKILILSNNVCKVNCKSEQSCSKPDNIQNKITVNGLINTSL
jgi:hypothetical protein